MVDFNRLPFGGEQKYESESSIDAGSISLKDFLNLNQNLTKMILTLKFNPNIAGDAYNVILTNSDNQGSVTLTHKEFAAFAACALVGIDLAECLKIGK